MLRRLAAQSVSDSAKSFRPVVGTGVYLALTFIFVVNGGCLPPAAVGMFVQVSPGVAASTPCLEPAEGPIF